LTIIIFMRMNYESDYFFGEFITALEALRIDCRELFLYSDAQMGYLEYSSGYYMPGKWFDTSELSADYREGNEQYLFMTQNDMNHYGYKLQTIGWQ